MHDSLPKVGISSSSSMLCSVPFNMLQGDLEGLLDSVSPYGGHTGAAFPQLNVEPGHPYHLVVM